MHQVKLDGWRCQIHRTGSDVRVFTRGGLCFADRLPSLVAPLRALPSDCVIDGELVLPQGIGVNFYGLTHATWPDRDQAFAVVAFDVQRVRGKTCARMPSRIS